MKLCYRCQVIPHIMCACLCHKGLKRKDIDQFLKDNGLTEIQIKQVKFIYELGKTHASD